MSGYITVPKSKEAQIRLDFDQSKEGDLLEVVISDEELKRLWKSGIFTAINNICGSMIDMYEDESITDEHQLRAVIDSGIVNNVHIHNVSLVQLFESALEYETGVFFFF